MNKQIAIAAGALLVLLLIILITLGTVSFRKTIPVNENNNTNNGPVACTLEAKLCPDGTYVGRVAPSCQFAPCPTPVPTSTPGTVSNNDPLIQTFSLKVNEIRGALNVSIMPLTVIEDSRCPVGVYCIQAGTVRLRARLTSGLGTGENIFTLGVPVTTEAEAITLTEITPAARPDVKYNDRDYTFTFVVKKR